MCVCVYEVLLCHRNNKIMSFIEKWMELQIIMLTKMNQIQMNTAYFKPYV